MAGIAVALPSGAGAGLGRRRLGSRVVAPRSPNSMPPTTRSSSAKPWRSHGRPPGSRSPLTDGGVCLEVEGDVDDEVLLTAHQAAASDLEQQEAHVDAVGAGGDLGVSQEAGVDAC